MLVVVFGAGASFDSNPAMPVSPARADANRPPLANALFHMDRDATRQAAAAFPRAAPALMAARTDVKAGSTVEVTLSRLQAEAERDPVARSQLMALRFYLQRVLHRVPDAWDRQADRQTSYVSMLDQLGRWRRDTGQGLCLITFNYDVLLERACTVVFGLSFGQMGRYQATADLHVYKPHGSVNWARAAPWNGSGFADSDDFRRHLCDYPDIVARDEYTVMNPDDHPQTRIPSGGLMAWLPALAIPVELKPDVVMPIQHREALSADLSQATAMLCVGWRAREQHFLRLLQDHLPSRPIPLYAVSGTVAYAQETVDNLWPTGRFDRYRPIGGGFAQFADPEPPASAGPHLAEPNLSKVLRGVAPTRPRTPGSGTQLGAGDSTPSVTYFYRPYVPLD